MAAKPRANITAIVEEAGPNLTKPPRNPQVPPAPNKSWEPGNKGQGGEGLSEGYGGNAGDGTGPSGPEDHDGQER